MNTSRCPHCGIKLGNFYYADACPHCCEELQHNTRALTPSRKKSHWIAQTWPARTFFGFMRLVES